MYFESNVNFWYDLHLWLHETIGQKAKLMQKLPVIVSSFGSWLCPFEIVLKIKAKLYKREVPGNMYRNHRIWDYI